MSRFVFGAFMAVLVMRALAAEAMPGLDLPIGNLGSPVLAVDQRLAGTALVENSSLYAQNIEAAPPADNEAAPPADDAQTQESPVEAKQDGFEGGGTFDYFADPRSKHSDALPLEYPGAQSRQAADQKDIDHYNLMMKAWQKN